MQHVLSLQIMRNAQHSNTADSSPTQNPISCGKTSVPWRDRYIDSAYWVDLACGRCNGRARGFVASLSLLALSIAVYSYPTSRKICEHIKDAFLYLFV